VTLRRSATPPDQTNDLTPLFSQMYPKLRNGIEPFLAADENGETFVGLRDQFELSSQQLFISQDLFYLLEFFDGKTSVMEIRASYMKKFNKFLFENRLQELIEMLDKSCLLDNQRAAEKLLEIQQEYRKIPNRLPVCAGSSYPEDATALAGFLDKLMQNVPHVNKGVSGAVPIKAVVAPHIDIRLGGRTFAHTYSSLLNGPPVDLFVILGIGHYGIQNLFALTDKNFLTPDGAAITDTHLVNDILKRCHNDFMAEELIHREEHSIELQTVFLNHYFKNFKILPVLCSFSNQLFGDPEQVKIYNDFIDSVKAALSVYRGTVCYIASVDFAHVGIKYGDPKRPDPVYLAHVEQNDRQLLNALTVQDRVEFQQIFKRTNDPFHVCGYSALTALLDLMPPARGQLLDYNTAVIDNLNSTVTFSSMIFS